MSAGDTLAIVDPNRASPGAKALSVVNTGGTLTAGKSLHLDAATFSADGSLTSGQDLSIALTQNLVNNATVSANRNLTYATTGTLTNNGKLLAGNVLTVSGSDVENTASGEMRGDTTTLLEAIDAAPSRQPVLLQKFVEHWYKETGLAAKSGREKQVAVYKAPYWHSYHLMEGGYFGYWCLEAVAAVKAFGIDDSLCVGHPHYPGDLLRPGVVTAPDMSRLLPELAATIDAEPQPPFIGEPKSITSWEAFKLVVKDKFGR